MPHSKSRHHNQCIGNSAKYCSVFHHIFSQCIPYYCHALYCCALHFIRLPFFGLHCLHCTVLQCTASGRSALGSVGLHCIVQCKVQLHYIKFIVFYCIVLHYISPNCITMHYIPFRFLVPYSIVLSWSSLICSTLNCNVKYVLVMISRQLWFIAYSRQNK